MELLDELRPHCSSFALAAAIDAQTPYAVIQVRTRAHRALRVLRRDFYGERKRVPKWLASGLNDRMLAIWFMDDGHTRIRPGRQPLAEIATIGFADADRRTLVRALAGIELPARESRGRLHFDAMTTRTLCERIAPFVPPSMRYKLPADVALQIPFDPSRWDTGPRLTMFDEVEVEDITAEPRSDTTFFCLDVEGTHNFVTSGGVVHNCRPPGNRDPMPDEIEACEPHLFKQIELIRPRVVATLGNFATKLLSGKPAGITRVHGQEQNTMVGGLPVVLYPLYHPAAALYTPKMLEVLRSDFSRIPELLGRADVPVPPAAAPEPVPLLPVAAPAPEPAVQLGLF
jgi:hypothetical protein